MKTINRKVCFSLEQHGQINLRRPIFATPCSLLVRTRRNRSHFPVRCHYCRTKVNFFKRFILFVSYLNYGRNRFVVRRADRIDHLVK